MRAQRWRCVRAKQSFGHVLLRVRKQRGLSQSELAAVCKVPRTYISRVECGRHTPVLAMIEVLSAGLRTTPWALVQFMYQPEAFERGAQPEPTPPTVVL